MEQNCIWPLMMIRHYLETFEFRQVELNTRKILPTVIKKESFGGIFPMRKQSPCYRSLEQTYVVH